MIKIKFKDGSFHFYGDLDDRPTRTICESCGQGLSYYYVDVINSLSNQCLLPDDFKLICCGCYWFKKTKISDICSICGDSLSLEEVTIWIKKTNGFKLQHITIGIYCNDSTCPAGGESGYFLIVLPSDYYD